MFLDFKLREILLDGTKDWTEMYDYYKQKPEL